MVVHTTFDLLFDLFLFAKPSVYLSRCYLPFIRLFPLLFPGRAFHCGSRLHVGGMGIEASEAWLESRIWGLSCCTIRDQHVPVPCFPHRSRPSRLSSYMIYPCQMQMALYYLLVSIVGSSVTCLSWTRRQRWMEGNEGH